MQALFALSSSHLVIRAWWSCNNKPVAYSSHAGQLDFCNLLADDGNKNKYLNKFDLFTKIKQHWPWSTLGWMDGWMDGWMLWMSYADDNPSHGAWKVYQQLRLTKSMNDAHMTCLPPPMCNIISMKKDDLSEAKRPISVHEAYIICHMSNYHWTPTRVIFFLENNCLGWSFAHFQIKLTDVLYHVLWWFGLVGL